MAASETRPRRHARSAGFDVRVFLVALALLGAARLLLPSWLHARVESRLGTMEGYDARLAGVDVNLWRGAYHLEDVALIPTASRAPEPRIEIGRADIAVDWRALLHGSIVAVIVLRDAHVELVSGPPGEEPRVADIAARLDELSPFRIDRFVVTEGEIRFRAPEADPPVDVYMTDIAIEALNFTNVRPVGDGDEGSDPTMYASAEAAGRPFETGQFEARLRMDPLASPPRFELGAELRGVEILALNDFLLAYGGVDAERGTFEAYTELACAAGRVEGYVKTLIEGLEVLRFGEIDGPDDALEALWEGFVGLAAEVLENQPHDRLATRIPVAGTIDDVRTDVVTIIVELLRNAFVVALRPALDDAIELRGLEIVREEPGPRDGEDPDDIDADTAEGGAAGEDGAAESGDAIASDDADADEDPGIVEEATEEDAAAEGDASDDGDLADGDGGADRARAGGGR